MSDTKTVQPAAPAAAPAPAAPAPAPAAPAPAAPVVLGAKHKYVAKNRVHLGGSFKVAKGEKVELNDDEYAANKKFFDPA